MRLDEINVGNSDTIELRPLAGQFDPLPEHRTEVLLQRAADDDKEAWLVWRGSVYPVAAANPKQQALLTEVVSSGLPQLTWVAVAKPGQVVVQIHRCEFALTLPIEEQLAVGIDETILADLRQRFRIGGTVAEVTAWLTERVLLPPAPNGPKDRWRAIISAGEKPEITAAFRMHGRDLAVDVKRDGERLRVERVLRPRGQSRAKLCLLDASLEFVDLSVAGAMRTGVRHILEEAVRASGSYLRLWETYNQLERKLLLRRARRLGALRYTRREQRRDGGWRFHLSEPATDLADRLGERDEWAGIVLAATTEPPHLDDPDLGGGTTEEARPVEEGAAAPLADLGANGLYVDLAPSPDDEDDDRPPESGYLSLSLCGDRVRLRRREQAMLRLRSGTAEMPQLGLLLEDRPVPRAQHRHREPLSPAVLAAFRGPPTERQIEALNVALNTPDVALIQGPPGTGKTQVITALERRLAELAEEAGEVTHQVLIASAQHSAVEHVVQKTEVFGLPAVKIGKRRGSEESGMDSVMLFRVDRVEQLRSALRQRPIEERLKQAHAMVVSCLRAPLHAVDLVHRLHELHDLIQTELSPMLSDRLLQRAASLARPTQGNGDPGEQELQLRAARGLRVEMVGFLDDGPLRANMALSRLGPLLAAEERQLLERCGNWVAPEVPPLLAPIQALRERLIDLLTRPAPPPQPTHDTETEQLLLELVDTLARRRAESQPGEAAVMATFLDDLEKDPHGVRAAIEQYTVVLGATCQHAASKTMLSVRGIDTGSAPFESVIIDEAARVSPLDLFIPLSLAKRRAVLVGDHRQLPHLLEPAVERELQDQVADGDLSAESLKAVQASLFERMWRLLRQLESQDGVRRTVTLDVQFRMPRVLGDFVSQQFYERWEDPKITSDRPDSDFFHALPKYQKNNTPCAAAWLKVAGGRGRAEHRGRSKSRSAEAQAIARELKRLIDVDDRLTFGVIAFYADQVDAIKEALRTEGLCEATDSGGIRVAAAYQQTMGFNNKPTERLRVGTVDSFQGKEFDVVLLSITRSNNLPDVTDADRRRKYGHLLLNNRLCVAMSRQQRLLIAVGDLEFIQLAEALPPLRAFAELCGGDHGVIL